MYQTVMVLGASAKEKRYSNMAMRLLLEHGHRVVPVNPRLDRVLDLDCLPEPAAHDGRIDTVTVYLTPKRLRPLLPQLIGLAPGRVILNPGTEDEVSEAALADAGVPVRKACTIVLLKTGQFAG